MAVFPAGLLLQPAAMIAINTPVASARIGKPVPDRASDFRGLIVALPRYEAREKELVG
jgi:hypothetical protein